MKKNLLKEKLQKGGIAAGVIIQDPAFKSLRCSGFWVSIGCSSIVSTLQ